MAYIYVMSDIHGFINEFEEALKYTDLSGNNKLVLLGDYIDLGPDSFKVLNKVFNMQKEYGFEKVIALRGNHEDMFLEFLEDDPLDWLMQDRGLNTVKTFLSKDEIMSIRVKLIKRETKSAKKMIKEFIKNHHKDLIIWLKNLPYFYETDKRIFVHAGIDEEAEEYWKTGSNSDDYVWKYPAQTGKFIKDVIAGHISTSTISGDSNFHDIFYDKFSHYYIDGDVSSSHNINVLKIDNNKDYYYLLKDGNEEKIN